MNRLQTVLGVDDSVDIHDVLAARLRSEGYELRFADSGERGLRMALELQPDLVLLDVDMPDLSGFEVCRRLKSDPRTVGIPIIFVTAASQAYAKVEGFDLGAVDYVVKPFEGAELRARVRAALRTKRCLDLLAARAECDGLTGLGNRASFERHAAERIREASTQGRHFGLVLVDIDHFKRINDRYGHPVGDKCIQVVAEVLASSVRSEDVACRYGGEEFALLLADCTLDGAVACAERVRMAIASLTLPRGGEQIRVTASQGVAATDCFADPAHATRDALVDAADAALYRAKEGGRDRVCSAARRTALSGRPSRAGGPGAARRSA